MAFPVHNERAVKALAGNWIHNAKHRIDQQNEIKEVGATPGIGATTGMNAKTRFECPICLDDLSQIKAAGHRLYSTTCGHLFCHPCIVGAVAITEKCPTCRQSLIAEEIRSSFTESTDLSIC